jgi:uncharacterized protein with HEPN domain
VSDKAASRIRDALDAMREAEGFVRGMDLDSFLNDTRTAYAVERCLSIVGEALRHVPEEVREAHPEVPWRDVVGMRNRLAHDYLRTDREIVWQTVWTDIPALRPQLERVLAALGRSGS